MSQAVKPIPEGYHALTPYLIVKNGARAIDFYKKAFGAVELFRMPGPDGKIGHAELRIGDSPFMLADENPAMDARSAEALGGSPISILIYVEDADAVFKEALAAGAEEKHPMEDKFYGDRSGTVKDPFGHTWHISTHKENISPEEMKKRADEFVKAHT